MKIRMFACLAVLFLAVSPRLALAGPLEDAETAHKNGDYATALRLLRDLAEQGDAVAQNRLGVMYSQGQGVAKDEAEAVRWYRKAAERGNADGENNLGSMYESGRGIGKDYAEAVRWYRKAAEQGNAFGENSIGYMYETGRGIAKDDAEAVRWYRKAAEQGNGFGENNLGRSYRDGRGVAKDDAQAVEWFRRAAEQGNAAGQTNLGYMYANGRGVAKDDTEAVKWYRQAAEQGYALGENNLGVMYRDGRGVAKNEALAVMWLRKAAERGNRLAQKNLAAMSARGQGDAGSVAEAITPPPLANTGTGRRADFDVGRVNLRMSEDRWESVGTSKRGIPYTGDRSGQLPVVTRYLLLRDSAGKFQAVLVVSASWGVGGVQMSWAESCQPKQNVHVVDNTHGVGNTRDCLWVTGPISTQRYLESVARDLFLELTARNVTLPRIGYAVSDEVGLANGSFLAVHVVFAADFKLANSATGQESLPSDIRPEAVEWGGRLAEAVRNSAHSLSGSLIFPSVAR